MVDSSSLVDAIITSLITSGSATLFAALIGIPLAAFCAGKEFRKLRVMVTALYGLPPVVVGVMVYSILSKNGALGGLDWLFTIQAMILAQTILILPLIWGGSWSAFESISSEKKRIIRYMGANNSQQLKLELSIARNGVMNAIIVGFGRAIAEVGAVIMVGGNIAGKTRVMTTSIVLETSKGNMDQALLLGLILMVFSFVIIFFAWRVENYSRAARPLDNGPVEFTVFGNRVFKDLSNDYIQMDELAVNSGEIIVLLGASGSGKTSLLKAIAENSLYGYGKIGWVPQNPQCISRTVANEVSLDLHEKGNGDVLGLVGLTNHHDQAINTLSGGEKQKLCFARAVSLKPALLLLDECTANLDGSSIKKFEAHIKNHSSNGGAVIMATHNVLQAQRLATRILFIHEGKVVSKESQAAQNILSGNLSG